jgi:DNA polymerase III epsilon subunit-like protein
MEHGLPDERLVFVDLETAGGEPWRPIIQIAAIAVDSQYRELERYEAKIRFRKRDADPKSLFGGRYLPGVWKRHAVEESVALEQFRELLWRHATVDQTMSNGNVFQVSQIVAHNAAFDAAFLEHWFDRHDRFLPASPRVLCTMQRAIWLFHEDKLLTPPPDFKLATLCSYFGVPLDRHQRHDALADVAATVDLYRKMGRWTGGMKQVKRSTSAVRSVQKSNTAEMQTPALQKTAS